MATIPVLALGTPWPLAETKMTKQTKTKQNKQKKKKTCLAIDLDGQRPSQPDQHSLPYLSSSRFLQSIIQVLLHLPIFLKPGNSESYSLNKNGRKSVFCRLLRLHVIDNPSVLHILNITVLNA